MCSKTTAMGLQLLATLAFACSPSVLSAGGFKGNAGRVQRAGGLGFRIWAEHGQRCPVASPDRAPEVPQSIGRKSIDRKLVGRKLIDRKRTYPT